MTQGMFLAKALYDNIAETPDELAFRRGDVLTVLEQEPGGLEGWWLCSVRGKHGIAPGNRLKILSGMSPGEAGSNNGSLNQVGGWLLVCGVAHVLGIVMVQMKNGW
ncbi:breast cancer anti-estrogen resistance protein 1 [Aplysia californica]|uniref:Breast cancer anti-estrogen resistance protein 1 n=1 Tax=Aplysia californica TaxID=6500 RepID=A0ABM1VX54_APLCA|nr:breast cancer anti-estrogen resistance protein 1 [Aplysia californica]